MNLELRSSSTSTKDRLAHWLLADDVQGAEDTMPEVGGGGYLSGARSARGRRTSFRRCFFEKQ